MRKTKIKRIELLTILSIEDSSVEEENGSDGCRFEELTPVQSPEFPPVVSYTLLTEEDQSPESDSNLVQVENQVWPLTQFFSVYFKEAKRTKQQVFLTHICQLQQ